MPAEKKKSYRIIVIKVRYSIDLNQAYDLGQIDSGFRHHRKKSPAIPFLTIGGKIAAVFASLGGDADGPGHREHQEGRH